jgi:hypothetical protein
MIFIGPGLGGAETELEVLGADPAGVLMAAGGVEGPLAHAAVATANDTVAVNANSWVLTSHTVTPPMPRCLSALFSFR